MSRVPTDQLGIKVLYQGDQVDVDIVAIHGLGALPDIAWKEKVSQVNWLQDEHMLPSAIPNSRILRFGYDSLWFCRDPARTSVETIANTFLQNLRAQRENCGNRPIIFIAHCFGGLVIQKALTIDSLSHDESSRLLRFTAGIVFFGTPHSGTVTFTPEGVSNNEIIALLGASSDLRLEDDVLESLKSQHNTLSDISKEFLLLVSVRYKDLKVINFFEQRISKVGKLVGRDDLQEFVVGEGSATLGHYPTYGLPLDHYSLNKFAAPNDGNFQNVRYEIKKIYSFVPKKTVGAPQQQSKQPSNSPQTYLYDATSNAVNVDDEKRLVILTKVDDPKKELMRKTTLVFTLTPILASLHTSRDIKTIVWKVFTFEPNVARWEAFTWLNKAGFCKFILTNAGTYEPDTWHEVAPNESISLTSSYGDPPYFETVITPAPAPGNIAIVNNTPNSEIFALYTIDPSKDEYDQTCPVLDISLERGDSFHCSPPILLQAYAIDGFKERVFINTGGIAGKALFKEPIDVRTLKDVTTFQLYSNKSNKIVIDNPNAKQRTPKRGKEIEAVRKNLVICTKIDDASRRLRRKATLVFTLTPILELSRIPKDTKNFVWKMLSFEPYESTSQTFTWVNKAGFCKFKKRNDGACIPEAPEYEVAPNESISLNADDDYHGYSLDPEIEIVPAPGNIAIVNNTPHPESIVLYTMDESDRTCPLLEISLESVDEFHCSFPVMLQAYAIFGIEERRIIETSEISGKALFSKPIDMRKLKDRTTFQLYSDNKNKVVIIKL